MDIQIRLAVLQDLADIKKYGEHLTENALKHKIMHKHILAAEIDGSFAGWLRYSLFWDEIPFMNMLFVAEEYRGKNIGSSLVRKWEELMLEKGYGMVMTSTQSNEYAQHFYRKMGYRDAGGFLNPDNQYEIILTKPLI